MGTSNISHVDDAAVLSTDLVHSSFHHALEEATRCEGFLTERRAHDEGRTDCDQLKPLTFREGFLEVPGSLLSKDLRFGVVAETLRSIGIAPVALVVSAVGWLVSSSKVLNRGAAGGDHASADTSLLASSHDSKGSIDSWLDELVGVI